MDGGRENGSILCDLSPQLLPAPFPTPACTLLLPSCSPPAPLDPPASQEQRRASAHSVRLLGVGFAQPGMTFPCRACGFFSLRTSEVPLSFREPSQDMQMKHFRAGQIVFIEFSSTLSSVLRRDILINYSPRGLKDQ